MIERNTGNLSVFEYASLCLDVYREKNRPPLPEGITVFQDYEKDGYFSSCYVKQEGSCYYGYIAHRGTIISDFRNIIEDLEIFFNKAPGYMEEAKKFESIIEDKFKEMSQKDRYTHYSLVAHTGHSLGAAIAELMFKIEGKNVYPKRSCTFESPGTKEIIENILKKNGFYGKELEQGMINVCDQHGVFLSNFNLINCCNTQSSDNLGGMFIENNFNSIFRMPNFANENEPIKTRKFEDNSYFIMHYTSDQHSIKKIYDYCKKTSSWVNIKPYPVGAQNCYNKYLNYNDNFCYWIMYMKFIWDNDKDTRKKFSTEKEFKEKFVEGLCNLKLNVENKFYNNTSVMFKPSKSIKLNIEDDFEVINVEKDMVEMVNGTKKTCRIM